MTTSDSVGRLPGSGPNETVGRFYVEFYNQWSGIWTNDNHWYDLTLIKLAGEYAPYKGTCEFDLGLFGLNWTFSYVYDPTFTEHLKEMVEEIKSETTGNSTHE